MNTSLSHQDSLENTNINANASKTQSGQNLSSLAYFSIFKWASLNQGAFVVVLDMLLAILSVIFNLMVITSIKENEELLGVTFNLVLISLCFSNLLSAVMVKSISIVHNAYAVASNSTHSDIAFCILYSFGYRLTWAVLPWSVVALSWLTVWPRLKRLQVSLCLSTDYIPTKNKLHS